MAGSPKKRARREAASAAARAAAEAAAQQPESPALEKRGPGRPSEYTRALADEICDRLSDGETLTAICRDPHMPPHKTVRGWVDKDLDGFKARYEQAREWSIDALEDRIRDSAYDTTKDIEIDAAGMPRFNLEAVARSKLKVDTDKWILSKRRAAVFGDRIGISGVADAPPIRTENVTDRDLARTILSIFTTAKLADGETVEGTALGQFAASAVGTPKGLFSLPGHIAEAELVADDAPAIDQPEIDLHDLASGDLCDAPGGLSIEFDRLDEATGDARWHILDRIGRRVQTVWGTAKAKALSQQLAETGKIDRSTPVDTTKPTPPLRKPFKPAGPIIDATPTAEMPFGKQPRAARGY